MLNINNLQIGKSTKKSQTVDRYCVAKLLKQKKALKNSSSFTILKVALYLFLDH